MDFEETSHLLAALNEKLDNMERAQALSDAGHAVRANFYTHQPALNLEPQTYLRTRVNSLERLPYGARRAQRNSENEMRNVRSFPSPETRSGAPTIILSEIFDDES